MSWLARLRNPLFWLVYLTIPGDNVNWNPNDPILNSPHAPHETRATLRMHRNGWPGPDIAKVLKIKGTKLMKSLTDGMDEEGLAHLQRRPIYDGSVEKGTV